MQNVTSQRTNMGAHLIAQMPQLMCVSRIKGVTLTAMAQTRQPHQQHLCDAHPAAAAQLPSCRLATAAKCLTNVKTLQFNGPTLLACQPAPCSSFIQDKACTDICTHMPHVTMTMLLRYTCPRTPLHAADGPWQLGRPRIWLSHVARPLHRRCPCQPQHRPRA